MSLSRLTRVVIGLGPHEGVGRLNTWARHSMPSFHALRPARDNPTVAVIAANTTATMTLMSSCLACGPSG